MAKINEDIKVAADTGHKENNVSKESGEIQFVKNSDTFVLLHVPPGKPNRKDNGKTRVVQKKQKGGTCWYYAMKVGAIIRPDYIERQNAQDRKWVSAYRKSETKLDTDELDFIAGELKFLKNDPARFVNSRDTKWSKKWILSWLNCFKKPDAVPAIDYGMMKNASTIFEADKKKAKEFCDWYEANVEAVWPGVDCNNMKKIFFPFMREYFDSPYTDIFAFQHAYRNKHRIELRKTFIRNCGLDPEIACQLAGLDILEKFSSAGLESCREAAPYWLLTPQTSQADPILQYALYRRVTHNLVFKAYDLKPIPWHPESSNIEAIIKELKKGKAILVGGQYGRAYDSQSPAVLNKADVADTYDVFYFSPGTHFVDKNERVPYLHAISVIGAEKKSGTANDGWIYFIDPIDESAPNQKRKIYVMSYKQFCLQCIADESAMFDGSKPKHFTYALS